MNPITSHAQTVQLGGCRSRSQIKRQGHGASPSSPNMIPSFKYVSNPTGSPPVLNVKPIKCLRSSGLHTEEPEGKGKGRARRCSGREPGWQEILPALLPLRVTFSSGYSQQPHHQAPLSLPCCHRHQRRECEMKRGRGGGKCFKNLSKQKPGFIF